MKRRLIKLWRSSDDAHGQSCGEENIPMMTKGDIQLQNHHGEEEGAKTTMTTTVIH